MIKMNDYFNEIRRLDIGETTRHNHKNCSAGSDTKRRLYLTRPAGTPGVVLGYCHNCQEHGINRQAFKFRVPPVFDDRNRVPSYATAKPHTYRIPPNLEYDPSLWPYHAKVWQYKQNLTADMIQNAGIAHDPYTNRVYLPCHNELISGSFKTSALPKAYQLRSVDGSPGKYLTCKENDTLEMSTSIYNDNKPNIAVVVEDLASGLHIYEAMHTKHRINVIVNYGTKVSPHVLNRANAKHNVIWLDNDNEHVKKQAKTMAKVMKLVTDKPTDIIEWSVHDPKHYTPTEIEDKLQGYLPKWTP